MRDFRDVTTATTCISIHDMPKILEYNTEYTSRGRALRGLKILRGRGLGILPMHVRRVVVVLLSFIILLF